MIKPYYEKDAQELSDNVTLTIPHIKDALESLQGQRLDVKQAIHNLYEIIEHLGIEQCKECGTLIAVDDDLYGGGFCDGCSVTCFDCDRYFNINRMICINEDQFTYICRECHSKRIQI